MKTTKLIAFHGKVEIKAEYVKRVKAHQKADEIVQGQYWEMGKGCAVGCTIHGSDHSAYERELGIPMVLARLEDRLFERLPNSEAKTFPLRFLQAIQPGADLSLVIDKWLLWMLVDAVDGVIKFAKSDKTKKVIQDVADAFTRKINGETVTRETWQKLRADAAAYADAYADADAAAAAAAYAAAYAYADAYADAAADAYAYAYAYADAAKYRIKAVDKLLEILKSSPVTGLLKKKAA